MKDERLSAAEASFIALEQDRFPMHVGAVVLFEADHAVTIGDVKALLRARMRRLPRFRQRISSFVGGFGPTWTDSGPIDLRHHVFHHRLNRPGGVEALQRLCATIHERPLDRRRPLWEVHLIEGLAHEQALLIKTHHALTDGLAGIEIAKVLFDVAPGAAKPCMPTTRFAQHAASGVVTALQSVVGLAFTAAGGPIAPPGPFNGPVGRRRTFATAGVPMETVLRIKHRLGGTVDDVVLAAVAAGMGTYLRQVGYPSIPRRMRAMVPVSTAPHDGDHLGDHVSAIFVDLPTGPGDLATLVREIATGKSTLRAAHAAAGGALLVEAAAKLPAPLHGAVLRLVSALPFANVIVSDVPGPSAPLYLLGRRITACFPMMPLSPGVGLSVAAVSLGGVMGIGVTADRDLVPDVAILASAISRSLRSFPTAPALPARRRAA